jgi:hypothetical protein
MKYLSTVLSSLLLAGVISAALPASGQMTGTVTGQTSVWQGPSGAPIIQQQLGPNTGVIINPADASVTPYTILTPNAPALPSNALPPPGGFQSQAPAPPSIIVLPSLGGY